MTDKLITIQSHCAVEPPLPNTMTELLVMMKDRTPEEAARLLERWMSERPPEKSDSGNARYKGVNLI